MSSQFTALPADDEVWGKGIQPSESKDVNLVYGQSPESSLWVRISQMMEEGIEVAIAKLLTRIASEAPQRSPARFGWTLSCHNLVQQDPRAMVRCIRPIVRILGLRSDGGQILS